MASLDEVNKMTLNEYNLKMLAFRLRQVDRAFERRDLAWQFMCVQATDKDGKLVYREFNKFFDYEKAIKQVYQPQKDEAHMDQDLVRIARRLEEYRRKRGANSGI